MPLLVCRTIVRRASVNLKRYSATFTLLEDTSGLGVSGFHHKIALKSEMCHSNTVTSCNALKFQVIFRCQPFTREACIQV